jgi:uncharacterized membrane protein YkoI
MKRLFPFIFSLIIMAYCSGASSAAAASPRENERLQQGKITKNEAEHLTLKKFPGAAIRSCKLTHATGHSVWVLDLVEAGAHNVISVQVDGLSGKIMSAEKP